MQIIKNWKDDDGAKQQKICFSFEDYISKVTISKNTSQKILNALNNYDLGCNVIVKDK